MFCTNCGHKMNESDEFCSECGTHVIVQNNNLNVQQTTVEQSKKKNTIKSIIVKYKKQFCIIGILLVVIAALILLFNFLFGFDKLSWNKNYEHFNLKYVTQSEVKLGVDFSNEEKQNELKYKVTCGDITINGLEITWDLTESLGECKIEVSHKLKKITKTYNVISFDMNDEELSLDYDIDMESDEDLDMDGLTNKEEKEYGTDPILSDSDMDGLNDYDEIFTYKTDPNKIDTDDDGLSDYDEIELDLNPLQSDSKGDGIKDGNRELTYNYSSDKFNIIINGKGNIASTVAEVNSNTKISNKKGLIDNLYTFYTDATITEALLTIKYTDEELLENGLNEDNLSIYYYNTKELKYEKIDTVVDKENNTLTATLNHFSNYVVGDSSLISETTSTQILFILDNSWSMYTDEQYSEIIGQNYWGGIFGSSTLDGSDEDGIRFTLTSDLVDKLSDKNYQIGLSEFRGDYANILKIGSDKESLKTKLQNMNGKFVTKTEGTKIGNALTNGIKEFDQESDNRVIIILTDGQDSTLNYATESIIEKALASDVKICSIGFGGGSNNAQLSNISNSTGCKFYSSSNADGLTELFDNIDVELNDNLVDIDGDNQVDGILVADSGFVVNRDGFSFKNFGSNLSANGNCYGMATFAQLYYKNLLPLTVGKKTAGKYTAYAYDLTKTYFKDYSNLYDYKLQTNALKYSFGFNMFGEENPTNLKTVENDSLVYSSEHREAIEKSGIYGFSTHKSTSSSQDQKKVYGFSYSTYEQILLDIDKMQSSSNIVNDDKQMFNAIYTAYIRQHATTNYSSGMDFLLWVRNVIGTESTEYAGGAGFINILKSRLNDSDAPVIFSTFNNGLHAINAISLVQDIENPNYYYIGVYDNNYPGEKRYIDIQCNKKICLTKANSYYSNSKQPIRVTGSLEYDLEYYNN